MIRIYSLFIILFLFSSNFLLADLPAKENNISKHIEFLAHDSLAGRLPGTPGCKTASKFITNEFVSYGLNLLGENGCQYFNVITGVELDKGNFLKSNKTKFQVDKDYIPYSYSENAEFNGDLVFAGFGMKIDEDSLKWNSFSEVDLKDKWVLMLFGDPDFSKRSSRFENYNTNRQKILTAKDMGAKGVIIVKGSKTSKKDELEPLRYDRINTRSGLPVVNMTRDAADKLLSKVEYKTIDELELAIIEKNAPIGLDLKEVLDGKTNIKYIEVETQNIIAELPGSDPELSKEIFVIGAHYDHLGMGGHGSGSRMPDTSAVHNGADDNASGVASMLSIAKIMSEQKIKPKRTIVFIAFSAEEMGIVGSNHFVSNPVVDIKSIKFMFNIDMIGRIDPKDKEFLITGTGTAAGLDEIVTKYTDQYDYKPKFAPEGFGPSDHSSFYMKDISVLNFFGVAHEDYHTPRDDFEKINIEGVEFVSGLVYDLASEMSAMDVIPDFKEAGPKKRTGGRRYKLKVTLGIMPDHAAQKIKGLRAGAVMKGRPADQAGMEKGDVIVAINGKPINDIYDYMSRLKELRPGDRCNVDVIRNNKKVVLIVDL
jgi:peptidase M28-like protein/PDZ domain-containing protein/PA domain-containing protein